MSLSLDGFCAHHEGQSHGIDWYCKQYFYIRLIYLNWTIHLEEERKTGSGWRKQLWRQKETTLIRNMNFLNFSHRLTLNNQRIRSNSWLFVITQEPLSPRGFSWLRWKYLHLISRVGRRFLGVLGEMRWGYERSCRTARCDSKSEATPLDRVTWNKRKQGDETQTQTSVGKLRAFCGTGDLWPHYSVINSEQMPQLVFIKHYNLLFFLSLATPALFILY